MYFGADYHPEHWVYPYAGTKEQPESRWERDAELMVAAGINVVRMGEFSWGLSEPEDGKFDFAWLRRVMEVMHRYGIQVVLGTPTAVPPLWLSQKHPEILPIDERGLTLHAGTRHAACLNSDVFWTYSKRMVTELAKALGNHPALIAWQIDNGIGGHFTEFSFNPETRTDWHAWLKAKYETIENLNLCQGLSFWGQTVTDWDQMPMPMAAPTTHNPALMLDWMRFSSDTMVAFVRVQAELLRELTPNLPVTTNIRAMTRHFDHFYMAEALDFVAMDSYATIKSRAAENACDIDMIRSLKKSDIRIPGGNSGFWAIEQKAGQVNWQDVNSLIRPSVVRLFTYQVVSRGADGVLYFYWRQPRIGSEQFYGGVLTHDGRGTNRVYKEISQIGAEMKRLGPVLAGTKVVANACILYSHTNEWALKQPRQPNKFFNLREHLLLFYSALHDRNIAVDFARPEDDLSQYRLVIAPSLALLSSQEAQRLREYVQNGGTLVATCNTALLDENHIAPDNCYPHGLQDVFGVEIQEFDTLAPNEENHLSFRSGFPSTHLHPARLWCDLLEPMGCQVMATYAKDFYAGKPALTMNEFGLGRAVYFGTVSGQPFYYDLVSWLRGLCALSPLLKVPDTVEVSLRQKGDQKLYFLLNHQNASVRISFFKPMHDFLSGRTFTGNYDLPPHGVLVLDEGVVETEGSPMIGSGVLV
ncbi:MAG: beta-galactosidase [Verrucomicrobiota bacterium]